MERGIVWLLVVASMGWATSSKAAERDGVFRLGAGLGTANIDFDTGFAGDDLALTAFAAYDFNRYLGIEAAYVDAGSPGDGVSLDLWFGTAMAVGSLPLVRDVWSMSARAGVTAWTWESVGGVKREGTDFSYGLGTAFDFARVQIRLIGDVAKLDDARLIHLSLQGAWTF